MRYHYTYRITNIVEKKYYYGVHSCVCLPKEDIGVKYFSSSKNKAFKEDIKENPQNYKYKVVKIFSTREEALEHEIFLHTKFNVKLHKSFYNESNQTSKGFDTTGKGAYIDENGNTVLLTKEEAKLRNLNGESKGRKYPKELVAKWAEARKGKKRSKETKKRMSEWQKGVSMDEKYGIEKSKELKKAYSIARKGKTYEEFYGDKADYMRQKRSEQFSKPKKRVICDICGKNVTINTLNRHKSGKNCHKEN